MIDNDGYRPNVGIVIANSEGRVLWARRVGQDAWQFPQGGIKSGESPDDAVFRELKEETGLDPDQVKVVGSTRGWLRYRLPRRLLRQNNSNFVGQKQRWYLLEMRDLSDNFCRYSWKCAPRMRRFLSTTLIHPSSTTGSGCPTGIRWARW